MAADGANLQLTEEERRVLRECRINSLYFRGIPLGAVSVVLARQAGKSGFLPQYKRFAALYYPGAFTLGLLIGLASYRRTCFEKIMRLDNSRLAEQVREFYRRAGIPYEGPLPQHAYTNQQEESGLLDTSEFEAPSMSDRSSRDSSSIPAPPLSAHSERPAALGPSLFHEEDTPKPKYTTYEELRRKNRNQLQSTPPAQHDAEKHSREESKHDVQPWAIRAGETMNNKRDIPPKRNKYGDVME